MRRLLYTAALLILAASCDLEHEAVTEALGERRNIKFEISPPATRSSLNTSDTYVRDINLFAYSEGFLDACAYSTQVQNLSLDLKADTDYHLYAVANAGRLDAPFDEDDLEVLTLMLDGLESLQDAFPMAWNDNVNTASTHVILIDLERLVSRIGFRLDASLLSGLKVTSVRLRQSALDVRPFAEGSAAVYVADGDYASASDISSVNNGGTVYFYALENCKGSLLRGNTDPWQKIPDNLGTESSYCTYLEVVCSASSVTDMSGTVLYRMYIGTDNCSNFDLIRNNEIIVTLKTTRDGLDVESWKIDASNLSVADYLEFVPSSITTRYGKRDTLVLETNISDLAIHTSGFEDLGLTYYRSGNRFYIDCECWYAGGGTGYITASGSGKSACCRIDVDNVPDGISVPNDIVMIKGTAMEVAIMPTPVEVDFHYMCDCVSSNTYVASISDVAQDTFEISAQHTGSCTMTATFGGLSASFNVTVVEASVRMTDVEVPQYVDVPYGGTEYCNFVITPSNATDALVVTPADESIATVCEVGRGFYQVRGRKAGKTTVSVVSSGGLERSFDIYVTTMAELRLNGDYVTLHIEDSGQGYRPATLDAVASLAAEAHYTDYQDITRTDYDTLRVNYSIALNPAAFGSTALPVFSSMIKSGKEEITHRYEENIVWTDIVAGYYYVNRSYYNLTGISFAGSILRYDNPDYKVVMNN